MERIVTSHWIKSVNINKFSCEFMQSEQNKKNKIFQVAVKTSIFVTVI